MVTNIILIIRILLLIGMFYLFKGKRKSIFRKKKNSTEIFSYINKLNGGELFNDIGINLTLERYEYIRNSSFIIFFLLLFIKGISRVDVLVLICFYILTIPILMVNNHQTLFGYVYGKLRLIYTDRVEREEYYILTIIKNMVLSNTKVTPEMIFEQSIKVTKYTKAFYKEVTILSRENEMQKLKYLSSNKTEYTEKIISLILNIQNYNDVQSEIELMQIALRERRSTNRNKKNQIISDIIYMPLMALGFIYLANFVYIAIVVDSLKMLDGFI